MIEEFAILMDFKLVFEKLLNAFKEHNVQSALMGGFALGLWGVGRTTVDLDFLVNRDDMESVDMIMKEFGYECRYRSENVSQYISPLKVFGEVDFLHAFRKASLKMIKNADEKEVFDGLLKVKVLRPEDIIGLKLQAIKNNPSRQQKDVEDIESLLAVYKDKMDMSLIEQYVRILEMGDLYKKIVKRKENENSPPQADRVSSGKGLFKKSP